MSENSSTIISFTFDELMKDVNTDKIFLFILAYEFDMNINQLMTLFNFSSDIFWTYINTLRPMLKLGDRKAAMLKQSARKVQFKWLGAKEELTDKEQLYYNCLATYINDSFTNGNECIHSMSIKQFPLQANGVFVEFRTGRQLDTIVINNQAELLRYIDSIESIVLNGEIYTKTSRVEYLLEKYYGDLNPKEIKRKNIKEVTEMLEKSAIDLHNRELAERSEALIRHRLELVHRNG